MNTLQSQKNLQGDYYTKQIITYMGNKRKLLPYLNQAVLAIKQKLQAEKLTIAEPFSGSGIVSRLLKQHASQLYVNDLAGYSYTLNKCYLANTTASQLEEIQHNIQQANQYASGGDGDTGGDQWVQKHWAPKISDDIQIQERAYYTAENARRIDRYRQFIRHMPPERQSFLLAPLLVECSIHANTSGHFAAYYKKGNRGHFGGTQEIDSKRITAQITLPVPIFSDYHCPVHVSQMEAELWIQQIPSVDLVYFDPPYNKHPYAIYYFMLEIINRWDLEQAIPATTRGQPKNWQKSPYNSFIQAKKAITHLLQNVRSKFILFSYNDRGIIPISELDTLLSTLGVVEKHPIQHRTYNRLRGIANYKRKVPESAIRGVKEYLWVVELYKDEGC